MTPEIYPAAGALERLRTLADEPGSAYDARQVQALRRFAKLRKVADPRDAEWLTGQSSDAKIMLLLERLALLAAIRQDLSEEIRALATWAGSDREEGPQLSYRQITAVTGISKNMIERWKEEDRTNYKPAPRSKKRHKQRGTKGA